MTLRQVLLFAVLCTASVSALVIGAGKWESPATHDRPSDSPTPPTVAEDVEEISVPGFNVRSTENVFVEAPPEPIEFEDPDHPGYRIRIPYYVAWTFHAMSLDPMANSSEGDEVGVLCRDVTLQMFREPKTHEEALALKEGKRQPVLVRTFKAKEARVHGRIASQLEEKGGRPRVDADRNSLVHLTKDVFIDDISEGLEIKGSRVKVWPKLGKAAGTGNFEVTHEAFVITGTGMKLEKLDSGRTLIEIMKKPNLRLVNELQAGSNAGDLFQVQDGEFREATIRSSGRALIRRDDTGPEEQLHIDMRGDVRMNQEGGRSLDADRLTVLALKQDAPDAPTAARSKGWRLRRLTADGHVNLKFLDETDPKAAKLFGATTDHLTHRVPAAGVPTTLMEGPTRITFEGDVPIDGGERKNGIIHAYARERVWIGPVSGYEPPPGVAVESLRRVVLEQEASIKRFGATSKNSEYDELEGDRIEVVFVTTEALALGPKKKEATPAPVQKERAQVQALEFLATGHVRLGGSRVEGRMDSLRALDLYGTTPLLITKGERTWLRFSGIGQNQRLLGANEETPDSGPNQVSSPTAPAAPGATTQHRVKPTWRLRRLQATGEVDVTTSLGGPSLGMPVHVMGEQITYDALRGLAELDGGAGRSAQIHAEAKGGKRNELQARHLSFDRNAALVHAKGAVRGSLWTLKNGTRSGGLRDSFQSEPAKRATAFEIRTDAPIQVHLVREPGARGMLEGAEQRIDIAGPLTASLQSDDDTIDRLRANRLDVALVLSSEPAKRTRRARASTPTARAPSPAAAESNRSASPRATQTPELTRVSLEAREVTATLVDGAADVFTATGKVLLRNEMGRIEAERLVYRARDRSADVIGTAQEQARAHFQDKGGLPNHVAADRFAMRWGATGLERITAAGSESRPVRATILDAGKGGGISGAAAAQRMPGELQRFKIRSHGRLVLEASTVTAYDVWITQQRSKDRGRTWTPPVHIYAQRMVVRGAGLLGGSEEARTVQTLDAEQVDLAGKETYFTTVGKDGKAEIWGHRFHYDVPGELLTLRGLTGKPVRFTQGTRVDMYYRSAGWNLRTGLPVLEGHRAVLSGKR